MENNMRQGQEERMGDRLGGEAVIPVTEVWVWARVSAVGMQDHWVGG